MVVDVVMAVAGHSPSTTTTATTTAKAIPPDDCPVWVRGLVIESPAIPRAAAVSFRLPQDQGGGPPLSSSCILA